MLILQIAGTLVALNAARDTVTSFVQSITDVADLLWFRRERDGWRLLISYYLISKQIGQTSNIFSGRLRCGEEVTWHHVIARQLGIEGNGTFGFGSGILTG